VARHDAEYRVGGPARGDREVDVLEEDQGDNSSQRRSFMGMSAGRN
jgi:hypothetical protein